MTTTADRIRLLTSRLEALEKHVQYLDSAKSPSTDRVTRRAHDHIMRAVARIMPCTRAREWGIDGRRIRFDWGGFEIPRDLEIRLQDLLDDAYANDDCPSRVRIKGINCIPGTLDVHFELDPDDCITP